MSSTLLKAETVLFYSAWTGWEYCAVTEGLLLPRQAEKSCRKFCIRYKGYVNLQGRSILEYSHPNEKHSFNMKYFWGKRLKHTEHPTSKKSRDWKDTGARFQSLKQPATQTAFLSSAVPSKLSHTSRSLTLHVYFIFNQENTQRKDTRDRICPKYFKGKMHWRCFALFGFFLCFGGWLVGGLGFLVLFPYVFIFFFI